MADIELLIKIDEEYIEQIDKLKFLIGGIEDRSLQINVINAIKNGTPLPKGHGRIADMDEAIKCIKDVNDDAPTVQVPHWIPVSERLPESCGMYIVTRKIYDCPDTAPIIMSDESWFDGQNTWHNDNRINHERGYLSDVIAWMPLPKPFEPHEK